MNDPAATAIITEMLEDARREVRHLQSMVASMTATAIFAAKVWELCLDDGLYDLQGMLVEFGIVKECSEDVKKTCRADNPHCHCAEFNAPDEPCYEFDPSLASYLKLIALSGQKDEKSSEPEAP